MQRIVVMLMFAIVWVAGCSDSTAPAHGRVTRAIYNIKVQPNAGVTDSIRISFTYSPAGCDSALAVEVRPSTTEIRFVASSIPTNQTCPYGLPIALVQYTQVYLVPPPHPLPFTAKFAEPGEPDSVRVVQPL